MDDQILILTAEEEEVRRNDWVSIPQFHPPETTLCSHFYPVLKTAQSIELSCGEMTALQMKPGAMREQILGFASDGVGEMSD